MKKLQRIITDVADGVREEMVSSIAAGFGHVSYEYQIGTAYIIVEVAEKQLPTGYYDTDVDVCVLHDNIMHVSPNLEQAITEALPDWFAVRYETQRA